ncbi:MAG TPA: hypothetical protein VEJ16_12795 [Alphaproteobacteria bacterium]|nr:hypothetical protein [Alphaproteobacteria bacterium]
MWRFLGGLAFGAGLGAVVSAFIAAPQLAYSDANADPDESAIQILHQVTRLDRLEDDQLAPVPVEKPVVAAQAAVATPEAPPHKHTASLHKKPANRPLKSLVADQPVAGDQQVANSAYLAGNQSTDAGKTTFAIYPVSGSGPDRGPR